MKKLVRLLVIIVTSGLAVGIIPAHSRAMAAQPSPSPQGPADPAEVQAFFDQQMSRQLHDFHIPGAIITVVRNGTVVFTQGYGYADLGRRTPFTGETLFKVGSVTKLFTATAVMQLVEQGKLDLNADVNSYLTGFKIPETWRVMQNYPSDLDVSALTCGDMTTVRGFA